MKDVLEFAAWAALIAALVFLFQGDPSVFDLLHKSALRGLQ